MIDAKGRVIVSNSTLRDVATCTTADVMRHANKLTGTDVTGQRTLGVAVHEVMHRYLCGGSQETALALFASLYKPYSDAVLKPEEVTKDGQVYLNENRCRYANAVIVLEEWLRAHPLSALPYRVSPELVEVSFLLPLGPFHIRGRMDAIVEDDGLWVLDFKTSGRIDSNFWRQYRMDSALTGYVWAAQQTLGEEIRGVIVEGIQMSEVPSSSKKCSKGPNAHGVPYSECGRLHVKWGMERFPRDRVAVAEWRVTAEDLARQHKATMEIAGPLYDPAQEGQFHGACYKYEGFAACDFAKYCEAGRPREFSPELFGLEPVKEH